MFRKCVIKSSCLASKNCAYCKCEHKPAIPVMLFDKKSGRPVCTSCGRKHHPAEAELLENLENYIEDLLGISRNNCKRELRELGMLLGNVSLMLKMEKFEQAENELNEVLDFIEEKAVFEDLWL